MTEIVTICKEHLFSDNGPTTDDGLTMIPKDIGKLNSDVYKIPNSDYSIVYNDEAGKGFKKYISLSSGNLFCDGIVLKTGQRTITDVFKDIADSLEKALTENNVKDINKVFFVGGTSIITPLRKLLINTVIDSGCCVPSFNVSEENGDVITLFGRNRRTISFDAKSHDVNITCYNAVAIGACIMAMDKKIRIKPNVQLTIFDRLQDGPETTENNFVIETANGFPFYSVVCLGEHMELWRRNYVDLPFQAVVDSATSKFTILNNELDKIKKLVHIVAVLTSNGVEFKAYDADLNVSLKNITECQEIEITKLND